MNYNKLFVLILLFFSVYLESVFISFPFVLITSIIFFSLDRSISTLILIFLASFMLDSLKVQTLGASTLFIFATIFLINLYNRKYEIRDLKATAVISLISSFIYSLIFNYGISVPFYFVFLLCTMYIIFKKNLPVKIFKKAIF